MSTDGHRPGRGGAAADAGAPRRSGPLDAHEAAQYARVLIAKYGAEALTLAYDRARRADAIGDQLALEAWRGVIAATESLLAHDEERPGRKLAR